MFFLLNKKNLSKRKKGFLLIEAVVMTAVILLVILGFILISQRSLHLSKRALYTTEASFFLEEGAEIIRILRDSGWNNISNLQNDIEYYFNFSDNTWSLSTDFSSPYGFIRKVVFSEVERDNNSGNIGLGSVDPGARLVSITVSWFYGSQLINKDLSFYIFDIF